jgi:hypothetical protein
MGAIDLESESPETFRSIDTLDDIARDSFRGRFINNQLGNWFARNTEFLSKGKLKDGEISAIANLLGDIKSGLDDNDPETRKLSEEIERWREKGVIPKRKLILKMKAREDEPDITEKFAALLKKEENYFQFEQADADHLLSSLDDVLKSAEAKEDTMFIHLAASIIYYLKMNHYKVGPFVKKLREIEIRKLGMPHAD